MCSRTIDTVFTYFLYVVKCATLFENTVLDLQAALHHGYISML